MTLLFQSGFDRGPSKKRLLMIPFVDAQILFALRLKHGDLADLARTLSIARGVDELSESPLLGCRCLLQKARLVNEPPVNE